MNKMGAFLMIAICMGMTPLIIANFGLPMVQDEQDQSDDPVLHMLEKKKPLTPEYLVTNDRLPELREKYKNTEWELNTPPAITEPNCQVKYQVTHRVPGRCTVLFGSYPACETGGFTQMDFKQCKM